jgi:hypothetical protein
MKWGIKRLVIELFSYQFIDLNLWAVVAMFIILNIYNLYNLVPTIKNIFYADILIGVSSVILLILFVHYEITMRRKLYDWIYLKFKSLKLFE